VDPAREPGWRLRSILLGVLLVLALVAALASAPIQARARLSATTQALTGWLWPTRWIWPLAVVLTPEAVKPGETSFGYLVCMRASGVGWLIQATVGSLGGVGGRANRAGWAA
jgi:hypothetical protein